MKLFDLNSYTSGKRTSFPIRHNFDLAAEVPPDTNCLPVLITEYPRDPDPSQDLCIRKGRIEVPQRRTDLLQAFRSKKIFP
jgi:hypothetical protein